MIRLQKYIAKIHKTHLARWLIGRAESATLCDDVPNHGYVAFYDDTPVAAAFLRVCEGSMAVLEGLVTNPEANGTQRHLGIDEAVSKILADARSLGVKHVLAYSKDESTLVRAKTHGFVRLPHTLIGLNLEG